MAKKEQDIRFGRFGTKSFTQTTRVNDFIDHLEQGRVMYTCCRSCKTSYFPPRADCAACLSSDMEWQKISGTGSLVSYSNLKYAPAGFEDDLPYTIALVDFGECQVFGRLAQEIDLNEVSTGMDLSIVVNELYEGRFNYVFTKSL